jgi:recombination protein RecA
MALSLKERLEKLNEVEATIKKDYGTGIVVVDGDYPRIPRWQLSSPTFNFILGGGYPAGRIIEIYGPESSGKTTINTQAAADIQKQGGYVVWVDAEHCFDPEYAHKFGLLTDQEHFTLIKPDSGEDALQIVIRYAASGVVDLIVVDSVAALVPKAELEGEMSDNQMGAQARMMGKAMRKLAGIASKSGTCVSFINQIRMKIGVVFGNPECVGPDTLIDID